MDTTDPAISFGSDGVCSHCRTYDRRAARFLFADGTGPAQLEKAVRAMKEDGRGKEYDCVIGVSGGVDSTYVAFRVRELGLRPLAVHLDNGWDSALAVTNIRGTLEKLKIDLNTLVLDWDEFRDLQLAFLRASTPDSEIPTDHAIMAVLLDAAEAHGIRHIVTGSNFATEAIMPAEWSQGINDWKYIRSVHRRFGTTPLRTFPHFGLVEYSRKIYLGRVQLVKILDFMPYVKEDAMRILQDDLGWTYYGGKHYESVYTRFFQSYILPTKFNFDKRRGHLSTLICSGQLTRPEALGELEMVPCPPEMVASDREFVIKKLGITEDDFEAIMAAPPKTFWDYPSYENSFPTRALIRGYRAFRERQWSRKAVQITPPGADKPVGEPEVPHR